MKYQSLSRPEKWIVLGIPLLFIIGSVMHFVYDIFWESPIAGLFAAVNESVWEHSKMVLLPVILWWSLYYFLRGKEYRIDKNKWFAGALTALIVSLVSIPMLYYFYTEAFGTELLWVDILILFLALLFGQILGFHVYRKGRGISASFVISVFVLVTAMFMVFTFVPPEIPLFRDGMTGTYGIDWKK